MYERFINQLTMYAQVRRVLSKEYLPISLLLPSKVNTILQEMKAALQTTNRDYDLVIKRIYLYYDMTLVTLGIDSQRNLSLIPGIFPTIHSAASDIVSNGNSPSFNCRQKQTGSDLHMFKKKETFTLH